MRDLIGRTLGHYRIVEKIGEGGMGVVYRAHDEHLDRDVAIKVLPEEVAQSRDRLERFEREAKVVAKLDHPNILAIHDFRTEGGVAYAVMELLEGESLRELVSKGGITTGKAVEYAISIADGLAAAHDKGIVHRDLKPENVFLTRDGRIKILDFGLAKLKLPEVQPTTETPTETLDTAPGGLIGTVPYMSPEQLQGVPADYRSDIFSLGAVLYEMLTSRRPFGGSTSAAVAASILKEDPDPFPPSVPKTLASITSKCLEKRPEDRFSSAHDLSLTIGAVDTSPPAPAIQERSFVVKRWPHVLAVVLAAVVTLLVILPPEALFERLTGTTETPPIHSIAVLPLENLTGDPEQQYFVDGLHDELIATFAQISGFNKVIARTSVMEFRDSGTPIREIGEKLDVDAVLEGSVRRSGDTVRATLKIIEARSGDLLWADKFDRNLTDILALQSEMARAATRAVNLTLSQVEQERFARTRPVDHAAYEAYLMGNHLLASGLIEENIVKAIGFYQLAIESDPGFSRAYSSLAIGYTSLSLRFQPPAEVMPFALEAANKAVELDEQLPEAHTALGAVKTYWQWDWTGAEAALKRALQLEPNNERARRYYTQFLAGMLRFNEAEENQKRAVDLSPLSNSARINLGWVYWATGQFDKSAAYLPGIIEQNPNDIWGRLILSWTYSLMGRTGEGVIVAEETRDIHPAGWDDPYVVMSLASAYGYDRQIEPANIAIRRLLEMRRASYIPASYIAFAYSAIDDRENCNAWWQKAYQERHAHMGMIRMFAFLLPSIGEDSRIQALIESMEFPEN